METGRKGILAGLRFWDQPPRQVAVHSPSPLPQGTAAPLGKAAQGDAMNEHIVRSYEDELALLDKKIAHMGGLAERILGQAFDALERRDPKLAEVVVRSDKSIDALEREIEEQVVSMIARRQPMADDLRHVMAALRITTDLERVGDLAKNIAKRALAIAHETHPKPLMSGLRHMGELALTQLKEVLDAYAERDAERALTVWREDEQLDAMYNSIFRELLTYMMEDPRNIGISTHLLFGAKNIERVGDHTTNIAETIHFLVKGVNITDDRPKSDDTSTTLFQKD
jgi:phosphate transport system protein